MPISDRALQGMFEIKQNGVTVWKADASKEFARNEFEFFKGTAAQGCHTELYQHDHARGPNTLICWA